MKTDDRSVLLDEFDQPARTTVYKTSLYIDTDDGIELYETLLSESPPALPDEGDYISVDWLEDDDGDEVTEPVDHGSIGSDEPHTVVTSLSMQITEIKTKYSKRTYTPTDTESSDPERKLTVEKTVILSTPGL